jgi:HSP20 family molecular chaperone IbpA
MIRELGRTIGNAVMESVGRAASTVQERRPLPVDLLESDEAFLAVFDAPGVTSEDVQVRFDDNRVEVRFDRFRDFYEDFEMRLPGRGLSLHGHVTLPPEAAVDPGGAEATLKQNGTLAVRIPKTEGAAGTTVTDESVTTDAVETDEDEDSDKTDDESDTETAEGEAGGDETDDS